MTALRHILSILLLPATVTLVVPYVILSSRSSRPLNLVAVLLGAGVIGCGLTLVFITIRQFATVGRGTLAPWDPPRHLVVAGVYRHVRNPMISGVVLILLGETLVFLSLGLLEWALGFMALNATYIPLLEEPMLARRFGGEYRQYNSAPSVGACVGRRAGPKAWDCSAQGNALGLGYRLMIFAA